MQSPTFFVTESDPRFNKQKQLTVTEAGRAVKVETDLPHLVSLGSGRFSTAVTLHPLPEGKTTVGCMNADIIIRGRGIHPEHCYFIHERDLVILFPISQLITVDGAKVTRPTILSQGTMICFGRSSYFRFNHPSEAQHLKQEHFDIYNETYSTSNLFSKKEPLYANEEMSNSSTTSTTEGSLSIPLYDNVSEIKASHDKNKATNGDSQSTICDSSSLLSSDFDQTLPRCEDPRTCSPPGSLSPFHSSFMRMFPDGSRRAANNQFFSHDRTPTSDLFDEKASHIPRPLSPTLEDLNLANWTGYDNVLELKEAMKKQEVRDQSSPEQSNVKLQRQSLDMPSASLIKYNEKLNPTSVGIFIGDIERTAPKIEHDLLLRNQASEPLDKRKVTFSIKEDASSHPVVANNSTTQEVASKPPSGKNTAEHLKKLENKREKRFTWNKRNTPPTAEIVDIPTAKPSFFKALMRSRSPSPSSKRSPSPTPPINSDIARRLSEPLKKSFKDPDSSLKEKFVGMKSSRDESSSSDEESVNSKSSIHLSSTNSSINTSQQSNSTLKDSPNHPAQDRSSSERVVTIRAINTTDDEKTCSSLLTEQPPIICNPWKVNLKSCNVNISFDNYKGEKLFSRDTVTTTVTVPGVAAYQASTSNTGITQVSTATGTRPTVEIQPRQKQNNGNPIYDRVYDGAKEVKMIDPKLEQNSICSKTAAEQSFSEDILKFIDGILTEESVITKNREIIPELGLIKNDNTENSNPSQSTSSASLIKVTAQTENNNTPQVATPLNKSTRSDDQINKIRMSLKDSDPISLSSADITPCSISNIELNRSGVNGKSVMFSETPISIDNQTIQNDNDIASKRTFHINTDDFLLSEKPSSSSSLSSSSKDYSLPSKYVKTTGPSEMEVAGKPPTCENGNNSNNGNKMVDEEMSALFGVRRGVLRRMKALKQKIEEIEEKERNIENLITRNSMSIDVLEKKQISEKDIKEFFTNATNVLDNLEEEGKKVEHQFVEANEYLTRINRTIGEMEKKKKQKNNNNINNSNNNNNNSHNVINNNNNNIVTDGNDNDDASVSTTIQTFDSKNSNPDSIPQRTSEASTPLTTMDIKISSGSSDNSSSFGSSSLLSKSIKTAKGSIGSLTVSDKSGPAGVIRNSTCRPLTRYFPVTDSSFDLKCYIELSGHNLDVCKTVYVESYRCCGFLYKMGRKWKKWHKRWFVFDRTKRHLACYLTEPQSHSQHPRSSYYFQSIRDVFADHLHMVKSPNPDFTFCVKLVDKNLFLMAASSDAMRIWIDVVFTGAEAYQDVS